MNTNIDFSLVNFIENTSITSENIITLERSMSSLGLAVDDGDGAGDMDRKPTGYCARISRNRTARSSDDKLHSIRKQTITRRRPYDQLTKAEINRIYMNKKLGRVKVTHLETIFEETGPPKNFGNNCIVDNDAILFGSRKVKRSLSCSDGQPSKSLKEKRKRKAKNAFGTVRSFKCISKKSFLDKMASYESNDAMNGIEVHTNRLKRSMSEPYNVLLDSNDDADSSSIEETI